MTDEIFEDLLVWIEYEVEGEEKEHVLTWMSQRTNLLTSRQRLKVIKQLGII
jgi:hypothetical protein